MEESMVRKSLIIDPKDTVAVLLEPAFKGDTIRTPEGEVTLQDDIDFAHKVALINFTQHQPVYKYGVEIGYVAYAVSKGTWIHSHNMRCDRGR
jgi:hypothetical protein